MTSRNIVKRRDIPCGVCGKNMHVVFYADKKYRGGHYFGKIPLHSKKELDKMHRSGTHKSKISDDWIVDVCNYDPKPYAHFEHWECPSCYWHPKTKDNRIQPALIKATTKRIQPRN